MLARLKAGCLDLEIETGRGRVFLKMTEYVNFGLWGNGTENEIHFLFHYTKLDHVRELYPHNALNIFVQKILFLKRVS